MPVTRTPYLHFRGNTRDAMELYHAVFGGALNAQTFKGDPSKRLQTTSGRSHPC